MKVLITGGSGRIGEVVIAELRERHEIRIFDIVEPSFTDLEFLKGDLCVLEDVEKAARGMDAIIHLAAIPVYTGEDEKIMKINVMGTFNVLEAAARNGVHKIVYPSSICAYGLINYVKDFIPDYLPIDEKHPTRPEDIYGLSKLVGENLCYVYSRRYNLSTICLRLATVLFPHLPEAQGRFLERVRKPELNKRFLWNYVHVKDAAQAIRLALEKEGCKYEVYNIGAEDVAAEVDSLELVKTYYPYVKWISNEDGFITSKRGALFAISKAKWELGYQPQFTWHDALQAL
ncbi:MAG: NAD(P)-dependent oxidoreductase [Chloroflexi bacterium]|nr:NAD(P)-dependent oxidoreductase [Chloroflexota bacterium]MCL5075414.1 NAD(P)-dependent oxidoreductase [Chloroflexota bacterium]